jgi:hypothetical protein
VLFTSSKGLLSITPGIEPTDRIDDTTLPRLLTASTAAAMSVLPVFGRGICGATFETLLTGLGPNTAAFESISRDASFVRRLRRL